MCHRNATWTWDPIGGDGTRGLPPSQPGLAEGELLYRSVRLKAMHYTGKTGTLDVRQRQCMVITFGAGGGRLTLGLVRHPGAWRWSSYRATAGEEEPPDFLATDWVLSQFHQDRARAEKEYRKFVKEGRGIDVWADLRGGVILGTERFVEALEPLLRGRSSAVEIPRRERLEPPRVVRRVFHLSPATRAGASLGW